MVFLCIFLSVIFLLHIILPGMRAKNAMLLLASLLFYAYGEPVYVLLMIASALFNYLCALLIERFPVKKNWTMALGVFLNLLVLVIFKYTGFLTESVNAVFGLSIPVPQIRLPIGISFFTFQAMSYVIDVYRGVTKVQKNFGKVLLYISFFPQLIAGPIVKYHDVAMEIEQRKQTVDGISNGIRRFITGLSKKVLISNTMGLVVDTLFAVEIGNINVLTAWIGALSYLFQIYFDFSGYSDMAIGLGEMFGFHFKENFNYPYISGSIREFWRRWHMSLSGWFQEYLYIPLGGNRKGKGRTVLNKFIVFFSTGIWHGANVTFLFWGIYHGCFLMLEEFIPMIREKGGRIKTCLQHIYTLLVVCVGFVFFRADSMRQGVFWVKEMFTGFHFEKSAVSLAVQQLTPVYLLTFVAAIVACCPISGLLRKKRGYEEVTSLLSLVALVLCILSLASGTYNPFIYFRF